MLKRVFIIDIAGEDEPSNLRVFVNPEIIEREGEEEMEEGCLSVPGIYAPVKRSEKIRLSALNRDGEAFEMDAEGLLAICIQHEIDHLDGKVFVDYLSRMKQDRIKKKLHKLARQH